MRNNTYATPELQEEADDEEAAEAAEAAAAIAAAEAAEEAAAVAAAQAAAEAAAAAAAAAEEEEEEAPYDDEEDDDGSGEDGDDDGGMVLGEDDRPGGWSEHEEDEGVYEAEKLVGYRVSRVRARFACMRAHTRACAAAFCMHACILPNSFFLLSCCHRAWRSTAAAAALSYTASAGWATHRSTIPGSPLKRSHRSRLTSIIVLLGAPAAHGPLRCRIAPLSRSGVPVPVRRRRRRRARRLRRPANR